MATPEEQAATMRANVPEKTGKTMDAWFGVLDAAALAKHGEMVKLLKVEHGVGHGFANLIATDFRNRGDDGPTDLVAAMYQGREHLRPIHDAVIAIAGRLGSDVELAPKKSYVSLRRSKQFGSVGPATKTQVEVCFNLKGREPGGRLQAAKGMATHKVRASSVDEIDAELAAWLREAYEAA